MANGALIQHDGIDWYRIEDVDDLDPFLMSVVSSSDLWMFASSRGPLTAGRIDADHALLPYETDDRIHRSVDVAGPITLIARVVDGTRRIWQPFSATSSPDSRRAIAKSTLGDRLMFEEVNQAWQMVFRCTWMPSPSYGWVREVELEDLSGGNVSVEVLDGLLDVMPANVDAFLEQSFSNLVDAYKRSETGPWGSAAVFSLESLISDRAEPGESLAATVIWSDRSDFDVHLDEKVVSSMRRGHSFDPPSVHTGRRGSFLLRGRFELRERSTERWSFVADVGLGHAATIERLWLADRPDAMEVVKADARYGSDALYAAVAGADGVQRTGDPIADAHHLSNVMFNVMRGGLFPHGLEIPMAGLGEHVLRWNSDAYHRNAAWLEAFGEVASAETVVAAANDVGDSDLLRLVVEYLPLAFSRRHGDPSRPWNRFRINVRSASGEELLGYEGNWRDIFQNWEALLISYPTFASHAVAKFVNASTFDGHNPYRITQDGVDWEVPEPDDPWANIGYWGDHQIVYLHRLVELWHAAAPGEIGAWLHRPVFTYADVPYRIADYQDMIRDPRNTITFDVERAAAVDARVERVGSDGRLLVDETGEIVRVGLLEKLIVPVLAKLTSFVPGGGIWMNTQRPEWNDANNALAGFGLSMVTLFQLHGYVEWLSARVVAVGPHDAPVSVSVSAWVESLTTIFAEHDESAHHDAHERRRMMDALGAVGDRHRATYDGDRSAVSRVDLERFLRVALAHLHWAIEAARRPDGLFDAYNVIAFPGEDEATVDRLGPMLEGQVAALMSGVLDAAESLALIEGLYASDLYRADQHTFMLYPAVELPSFLDRNRLPAQNELSSEVLDILIRSGVVERDREGALHFSPALVRADLVREAVREAGLDEAAGQAVLDLYESVFGHHRYTGRSGSMHGYEGIGSVYWHMVGKLLVAAQTTYWRAIDAGEPPAVVEGLAQAYRRVRAGLGFCKSPAEYGAVPTDCYSHTPAHSGAQQPGMTGHVKELIVTRFGELGLRTVGGVISLNLGLLERDQVIGADDGSTFSYCGTPFELVGGDRDAHAVRRDGSWAVERPGLALAADVSAAILGRTGEIDAVRFSVRSPQ